MNKTVGVIAIYNNSCIIGTLDQDGQFTSLHDQRTPIVLKRDIKAYINNLAALCQRLFISEKEQSLVVHDLYICGLLDLHCLLYEVLDPRLQKVTRTLITTHIDGVRAFDHTLDHVRDLIKGKVQSLHLFD